MNPADETPVQNPRDRNAGSRAEGWFGELTQRDFDVEFYERILRGQPNDIRLLRLLGELYARKGRYDRSLEIDQKLVELLPEDAVAHYNLACSLAMRRVPDAAVESLARAIQLGYNDFAHLEDDPDLNNLRSLPQYHALLKQYQLDG
jgi:tetratricopeptide (TPR) repeat protein